MRAWFTRCWRDAGGPEHPGDAVWEDDEDDPLLDLKTGLRSDEPGAFGEG